MHALITGIGRKNGIAAAIARALADGGWELTLTGAPAYDIDSPWSEGSEAEEIVDSLGGVGSRARCCTATAAGVLCAQTEPFLFDRFPLGFAHTKKKGSLMGLSSADGRSLRHSQRSRQA